jgi:hypothetical protein
MNGNFQDGLVREAPNFSVDYAWQRPAFEADGHLVRRNRQESKLAFAF